MQISNSKVRTATLVELIVYIVSGVYFLFMLSLVISWRIMPRSASRVVKEAVTIVIPARNEEKNIVPLLRALNEQKYAGELHVIVVNDHSTDQTKETIEGILPSLERLRVTVLDAELYGKKNATTQGITVAATPWVLLTDADVIPGAQWVNSMMSCTSERSHMIFGPVVLQSRRWLGHFQFVELLVLNSIGAIFSYFSYPGMVNGANMAVRKATFEQLKGFQGNEHVPTGDDEFLLRKIHKRYRDGVIFCKSRAAMVSTEPESEVSHMMNQRKRWASKWKYHRDFLAPLGVLVFNAFFLGLLVGGIIGQVSLITVLIAFHIKCIGELMFIHVIGIFYQKKINYLYFWMSSMIYPIYAVFMGVWVNFGSYHWKEREYNV